MQVVVVALGKIGLPLAAAVARAGHEVVGCDVDERVVREINDARAPFPGEADLDAVLAEVVGDGRLRAVADTTAAVADGPDLVIAVPPLIVDADARPDWRILDSVVADIGAGLQAGTTVSIETTLPVGSTRERIAPALQEASGLTSEEGFFTVFSPERVFSGRIFRDLETYPKLVGGLSEAGERRGCELYGAFLTAPVWAMGSAEAAELTKLAETTYRDLNIAFANELARAADARGLDAQRVIDAANSQPFSHIHRPGIAVGGHCIPVYPRFYLEGDPDAALPRAARAVNDGMPAYAVGPPGRGARRLAGGRPRPDPRRHLPRRREGDGVQRRVRRTRRAAGGGRCAGRRRPAARRGGAHRARLRAVGGRAARRRDPAGRPRRLPHAGTRGPAGGPCGARRPRHPGPGGVRRVGGRAGAHRRPGRLTAQAARVPSAATTRAPACPSP